METNLSDERILFLKNTRLISTLLVVCFLLAGIAVRLIDLSDPPLDFAATRQLHSLVMARGYYYAMDVPSTRALPEEQRQFGIKAGNAEVLDEPPILEYISAYTYVLVGGESFEIPRLYSIFLWVIGGIPLFLLTKKFMSANGALAALAFYELLPFGVVASRSFQPDPAMVTFILFALYYQYRWVEKDNLANALLAGIFTSLAIVIKAPAVFFVGIPFVGLVLSTGFRKAIRNWRVYMMAVISLLPALLYYALSATVGNNSVELFGLRFFPALFIQPKWYQSWFMMAKSVVDFIPLFMAILAFFLLKKKESRILYGCLWIGYLLQGFIFAYHISSHNYYQLPIIPIVAIGFGYLFATIFEHIETLKPNVLAKIFIVAVLLFGSALVALKSRSILLSADYRYEEKYWKQLGDKIGHSTKIAALTHDYGLRLSYWGYIMPTTWETQGDQNVERLVGAQEKPFEQRFREATAGCDYFLVTLIGDFNSQADLHKYLFDHYPYEQGEGYYLFDLRNPLPQTGS